ncbi:Vacuolar inheritance and morphology protein [Paraconiothyrium brasiliense]|uniref:Vacuolar inheritance and morphology protein n=1 Tax=Paraconiothyrium brasiliense TaxID=300254 RepID=A0ABR3QS74_9PLEO
MTDSHDDSFRSLTGSPETAEPASTSTTPTSTSTPTPTPTPTPTAAPAESGPAPMRNHSKNGARSLNVSGSQSAANSPMSSRNSSPARHSQRADSQQPKSARPSRKSSNDVSPNRGSSLAGPSTTIPSAAAIQRALSSANIPQLPPAASAPEPSRVPRPSKSTSGPNSGDNAPHWPVSPRLKSPPPSERSRSRKNSLRTPQQHKKTEPAAPPSIIVQSSSPGPASRIPARDDVVGSDSEEAHLSMKSSGRGASGAAPKLETVQESSVPTSPGEDGHDAHSLLSSSVASTTAEEDHNNDVTPSKVTEDLSARTIKNVENGTDGGARHKARMQEQRSISTQRPNAPTSKPSFSSLNTVKSRTEAPLRNMTVETETVPSVAQTTIGNQDRSASGRGDGSLRLKPSNETIRPRKERKPPKRKAPSINSGTDVFEQKVASEVNEADSSDSEATFIYESNPPEQQPHRSRHHHSRTPSMTSIASLVDPRLAIRNEHKNPDKKPSMKFPNPYNNANGDYDGERSDGTVRLGSGRTNGSRHHHHIGRHGQGRGALHHLVMDSDSSLVGSSRARAPSSRHPSQPNSPRFQTFNVANGSGNGNGTKKHGELSTYDIDTENAADDERTPLISTRSPRARTSRHGRPNSATLRQLERRNRRGEGNWCQRFAGCLVASIIILVVVFTAVGVVFASTKQLTDLKIREIQNVVASQEEIIMDLVVGAVNPNIVGITVSDMDVIMFAKSKHVGSDKWWREHGNGRPQNEDGWLPVQPSAIENDDGSSTAGVDEGTDPIEEPRTMSLGRIFHFDSPLTFDGTFFTRRQVESVGEIRLSKPGNKTEAGGTERWEEVLQYPFELIVRGTFKYELPLSTHVHKVSVTASYDYDPDAEKKKLKVFGSEGIKDKRRDLSFLSVISAPVGRFDRRMLPLLDRGAQ